MASVLMLEDGSRFEGEGLGQPGERIGRVMLSTGVVGYQEVLTDPANAGRIVVFTYPLIGNYGVAEKFNESAACHVAAVVVKETSRMYSNWQAEGGFVEWLSGQGVVGIRGVDTRSLAVTVREKGEMLGIVSGDDKTDSELLGALKEHREAPPGSLLGQASVGKVEDSGGSGPKVAVLDLGLLRSQAAQLAALGCRVVRMPYDTPAEKVLAQGPDGVIVSGGPEDDPAIEQVAATVRALVGKVPLMGISAGHEAICLALGGRLRRMKLGHHGVNYPVRRPGSNVGEITVQNHSLTLEESTAPEMDAVEVTLRNVNDDTIEEVCSPSLRLLSAQYCPASPGFGEVHEAFRRFLELARPARGASNAQA